MKNSNRGKIVILTLLLWPLLLFGGDVTAKLDRAVIYPGESAVLTITAKGEDITFPKIDAIGGYPVLGTSSAQSIVMINGKMEKSLSKSYTFAPDKSVRIPSFTVVVDGKNYRTPPLNLKVAKPTAAAKGAPVQLQLRLEKKRVYVGEPVRLDLVFRRLPSAKYDKVEISEPELKDFWVKKFPRPKQTVEGEYIAQIYSFILFPQKEGNFTIPPTFAKLGTAHRKRLGGMLDDPFFDDPFFGAALSQMEWKKLFSNQAKLEVKPLPGNLEIYGDFKIEAKVDKTEVHANKPVNLTLRIFGEGNLDDIGKFDLDIEDAVVYADEPTVKAQLEDGRYKGVFTQKIAIVAERDFVIPSIRFTYFDAKTKQAKTIETKPIKIHVKGAPAAASKTPPAKTKAADDSVAKKPPSVVEPSANMEEKVSDKKAYLWFFAGFVLGGSIALTALFFRGTGRKRRREPLPILKRIEKARDDETLFRLLIPYAKKDPLIKETLEKLEKNIYGGAKEKIDKDRLLDLFEEMEEEA